MSLHKKPRILITRPSPQGQSLATLLAPIGIETIIYPTLVIQATTAEWQKTFLTAVTPSDICIFVSPTAVNMAQTTLESFWSKITHNVCMAIGKGTAEALRATGMKQVIYPIADANSEAVLALPLLQRVQGQKFWLFRGDGGRELLPSTLRARGAEVTIISCYCRAMTTQPLEPLIAEWQKGFELIVNTSNVGLRYLQTLLGPQHQHLLQQTPVTVFSESMLRYAQVSGIQSPRRLPSARNHDIVDWIMRHL